MRSIFIIGAGRSSSSLITYLLQHAKSENWKVKVGDVSIEIAKQKVHQHTFGEAILFDINNEEQRQKEIESSDLVISMLPATMHGKVAQDCVHFKKNLVTASYVSDEMRALDKAAKDSGIVLLNEIGLDPGIDHMSAMQIIDRLKANGADINLFKSYCGGLVAPESNDNPWGYKFSWNPRNVVLAGQSTAQYIQNSAYKYIPYNRLFTQIENIEVSGLGNFDGYANRDSLAYRQPYGLENIATLLRGTLRMTGYCKAWNVFVKLGLTDDTYRLENVKGMTYRDLIESYLPFGKKSTEEKLIEFMGNEFDSETLKKLTWLGILGAEAIELESGSPAQLLQHLLEKKWLLQPNDKDMIVMQHQFEYTLRGQSVRKKIYSTLVVKGDDSNHTAMAKTVGLPMAIAARKILNREIKLSGVQIPVLKEIYEPVLHELEIQGIRFTETEV